MIGHKRSACTCTQRNFCTVNATDQLKTSATHKATGLLLEYAAEGSSEVLNRTVDGETWGKLCALSTETALNDDVEGGVEDVALRHVLHRVEHRSIMEVVRFHECSCHAGLSEMTHSLKNNVLLHCPIRVRDVDNL